LIAIKGKTAEPWPQKILHKDIVVHFKNLGMDEIVVIPRYPIVEG